MDKNKVISAVIDSINKHTQTPEVKSYIMQVQVQGIYDIILALVIALLIAGVIRVAYKLDDINVVAGVMLISPYLIGGTIVAFALFIYGVGQIVIPVYMILHGIFNILG